MKLAMLGWSARSALLLSAIAAAGLSVSSPGEAARRLRRAPVSTSASGPNDESGEAQDDPRSVTLKIAALDRKLAELETEEGAARKELGDLSSKIADARGKTVAKGRAFYRLTRAGVLPVGGGFDELVSHAMRVERARRLVTSLIAQERTLRERGGELARTLERIGRDRAALQSQRSAMDAARIAAEEEDRRELAFDRAFQSSSGASEYVAIYGGGTGASDGVAMDRGGFAASKGRLLFPVAGRAEAQPARREGTTGPGLEIRAQVGTPVRAVYAGRVAFADRYGPYGRLVIVDHGDHYYSVSGNLASIDVKVGDEVGSGERVGTVGDEGKGAMLYFEVRRGTDTLAPGPWLGL